MTSHRDDSTSDLESAVPRVGGAREFKHSTRKLVDAELHAGDGTRAVYGEMAELIESVDWPRSPLGPSVGWPQSLKTALNICLRSRFQLAIFWGPELIFLYNDAEREVIGSLHPHVLGKPARQVLVD